MARLSRAEMRALAADQEFGANLADEGAADARRRLAAPSLAGRERGIVQAALAAHTQNARELRENAAALRDGHIPEEGF